MLVMLLVCFVMLSFMLEGEPHLKVVDEIKDSGKRRKFQVCSACVCVRACMCGHVGVVTGCVHMYNVSPPVTQYSILARQCKLIHVLFALFTITQGRPQMLYLGPNDTI